MQNPTHSSVSVARASQASQSLHNLLACLALNPSELPPHSQMAFQDDILAEIPRLRRYARVLTGDAARADDLVQDTLERALNKWTLWRAGNLRGWLLTMMHNVFVNQWRATPPLDYTDEDAFPEHAIYPQPEAGLALEDLDRALQTLTPEHREILLLIGVEELSYEEVAAILKIPVGTVMSRLYRAREKLRCALRPTAVVSHLQVVK